jgi:transcriptional regulator with XRE-family HTH domain
VEQTLDLDRLLEALNRRFRDSGRTQRDLERELGLGHGTLGNILRGTTALRLHHVELLGKGLGFTLPELLNEVFGTEEQA